MSDQTADGRSLDAKTAPVATAGEPTVDKKPIEGQAKETKNGIELVQTYVRQGNEMVVVAKILESMNRNLAVIAQAVLKLAKEDGK